MNGNYIDLKTVYKCEKRIPLAYKKIGGG